MTHSPWSLEILLEDDHLLAVVKPAGLATAHAPRDEPSVYALARRTRPFVGIVSRLDLPVSGIVVLAKTRQAAADLAGQFRDRTVAKEYIAVVEGRFPAAVGVWVDWDDTIARKDEEAGEGDDDELPGREAHARARVVRRAGEVSLVELEPSTGRRHQLRVQLANRRCPIVGDRRYGARLPFAGGIALHSRALALDHPATGARLRLVAPPPMEWGERFPPFCRAGYV